MHRANSSKRRRAALSALMIVSAGAVATRRPGPGWADGNESVLNRPLFAALSLGGLHSCARFSNGSVKCWGGNLTGALGLGDGDARGDGPAEMGDSLPTIALGSFRTATAIAASTLASHSCAILNDGAVKCWGDNTNGQLGVGDTDNRGDGAGEMGNSLPAVQLGLGRTAVSMSTGGNTTCAILDNADLKCWGRNIFGQLGQGDIMQRGDTSASMGDALLAIDLGAGGVRKAVSVSAGFAHVCALLDDASVKCWGIANVLGVGHNVTLGNGPDEMGDNLPTVQLGTGRTAVAISSGGSHSCALLDNGSVKCWGRNGSGQLGQGDTRTRGDEPAEMGDNLPAVSLGTGRTATAVTAGDSTSCALLDNGSVKCWGASGFGETGTGSTNDRGDAPGEMGDNLPAVNLGTGRTSRAITAGGGHVCAILDDNATLKCWGANTQGQLGLGDVVARGTAPGQMGDNLPPVVLGANLKFANPPASTTTLPGATTTTTATTTTAATTSTTPTTAAGSVFIAVPAQRVFDTRPLEPGPGPKGFVGAGMSVDVDMLGVGGVPNSGVSAVAFNLTATDASAAGFVTVWATGQPRPLASSLNLNGPGSTVPNLVIVPVGAGGRVSLYSSQGAHLVGDIAGYFQSVTGPAGAGRFVATTPSRLFDTRPGEPAPGPKGLVVPGQVITVQVTGRSGLPAAGVSAVVVNLTGTDALGTGFVTVYPTGQPRPVASVLNLVRPGHTSANLVIVPVGTGGQIQLFSESGAHLLGDVTGYFTDASAAASAAGLFVPAGPARLSDTRPGEAAAGPKGKLGPDATIAIEVSGRVGLPASGIAAVVANFTATDANGPGFVTVYPSGQPRPLTSTLNLNEPGETRANSAIMALGTNGQLNLYAQSGAHLLSDTAGYFTT